MWHSPILLVHIWAGIVALPSGIAAIVFRKGSPRHVLAGKIFVASMLTLSIAGAYLAIVKHDLDSVAGGLLTFYMVGTAWLTARRGDGKTSRLDWVALLIPLVLGIVTWISGIGDLRSGASEQNRADVGMGLFMGSVMLVAAAGDVRMLLRGGLFGTGRIARHLWRMCFGLFIAAGSFFLGGNNRPLRLLSSVGIGQHLPQALFSVGLYSILTLFPLVLLIFWLIRVRFRNAYTGQAQSSSAEVPVGARYNLS
jgi:uncharacterized membrane protein